MSDPGHIYVLINPSIKGLLKIGKTTLDPETRAIELSRATGVPTPFHVAFSIEVADCDSAEEFTFALLEAKGFRRTPNREFFEAPLRGVIEVLLQAQTEIQSQTQHVIDPDVGNEEREDNLHEHPGASIYAKAVDVYSGHGDEIEDNNEGMRLLKKAATLNFAPAYTSLAECLLAKADELNWKKDVEGMRRLQAEALEILREGSQKGYGRCYVKMASIYEMQGHSENATKCWRNYFRGRTFINNDDLQWGCFYGYGLGSSEYDICGVSRGEFARLYFFNIYSRHVLVNPEILKLLRPHRSEILGEIKARLSCFSAELQPRTLEQEKLLLEFVDFALSDSIPPFLNPPEVS
jgi:hypothetical protein